MAKAREQQPVQPARKKESPAEPSEILVNRLGHLSMICHESITVSSGLGKQEEFGSQHTGRREGVRGTGVGESEPTPTSHGHREGGR